MQKRPQGRQRLERPGLDAYIRKHYGQVANAEIAEKFNVTPDYLRNLAKRLGLSRQRKEQDIQPFGLPKGYTRSDVVSITALGMVLQKGAVRRHTMRG